MTTPLGLGGPRFVPSFVSTPRTAETEADPDVADTEAATAAPETESEAGLQPGLRLPRRIPSRDERRNGHNPFQDQLRQQIDGQLAPAPLDGRVRARDLGQVPTTGNELVPGQGGKGQGPATVAPNNVELFGTSGHAFAQAALRETKPPSVNHPYMQQKTQEREDLTRLGLLNPGTGRVHIDDRTLEHGFAVTRAAVGPTSLAQGASTTLNISGVPADFRGARRSEEQNARTGTLQMRTQQAAKGELTGDGYVELMGDELEGMLLEHGDAVAHVRSQLPEDGKDTFMNMSWGQSPERLLGRATGQMLMAPEGSPAYEEVTALLGHPPTVSKAANGHTNLQREEFEAVRGHLLGKLDPLLASDEHNSRMKTAQGALERELAAGREQGLLVFAAAGNEHASASRHDRPDLATSTSSGAEGLVLVGAVDVNGAGFDDDVIGDFSNSGDVTVSAAGVDLPVEAPKLPMGLFGAPAAGLGQGPAAPRDGFGTSYASPVAVEAAYLADAVNPDLGVNDIEGLLTDPRVVHDIAGSQRDGAGRIDHFAVALLAKNPDLTRAEIDQTRAFLRTNPSDAQVAAFKTRLGLD